MKLSRSRNDRRIAGVCGGLAKSLGWGSTKVRIIWVLRYDLHCFRRRDCLSGALVSDAERTAARDHVRAAAVAAVEKVEVKLRKFVLEFIYKT